MKTALITGKTYDIREALKALGGQWDPPAKGWRVPEEKAADARALLGEQKEIGPPFGGHPPFGELWQPCERPVASRSGGACDEEPSCCSCEVCARHCRCSRGIAGDRFACPQRGGLAREEDDI